MSDLVFFGLLVVTILNLIFGMSVSTSNFRSALLFKVIPVLTSFFLGLVAFKVIV